MFKKVDEEFNDKAGFIDDELQETINNINWYQTSEEVVADEVWIKETTQAIIKRQKYKRSEHVFGEFEGIEACRRCGIHPINYEVKCLD